MKPFYIVPNTRGYHDAVNAESAEDALVSFAQNMDTDISTYFNATDKEPVQYPHRYPYPDGKFQLSMSIIIDTVSGNEKATYYVKDALDSVDLSRMDIIARLQESYEMLSDIDPQVAYDVRRHYYRLLKKITGFKLDKKPKDDPEEMMRIYLTGISDKELKQACHALDQKDIPYDMDNGERFLVKRRYVTKALRALDNAGFNADII